MMAGVAGALYVPQVGIINPSEFHPANSIEAVVWVAIGGRGTLVGAALGAVSVNWLKTVFTSGVLAPYWLFALGALFVLVTLAMPKGLIGLWDSARALGSPLPWPPSGRAELTPPGQCGDVSVVENLAACRATPGAEVVVNVAVKGHECRQVSHAPEPHHGPFPSSEWLVGFLNPIVQTAAAPRLSTAPRALRAEPSDARRSVTICLGGAMPPKRFSEEARFEALRVSAAFLSRSLPVPMLPSRSSRSPRPRDRRPTRHSASPR